MTAPVEISNSTPSPEATRKRRKEACHLPTRKASWADAHAPSLSLPLRFIATGILSFLAGIVLLAARPDVLASYHYNQYVIAATHIFVLGFGCSIVMGAMYQLTPVAVETRLFSERLARWHFPAHLLGAAGMVWSFWIWNMNLVGVFGALFAAGAALFIYNIVRTIARAPRRSVASAGLAGVLFWLAFTVVAGLVVAASKIWPVHPFDPLAAMHAHAHAGVLGIFILAIVAVSFRLLPMFALSELQSPHRAAWSLGLINAGLLGLFAAILWQSSLKPWCALVIVAGLAVYAVEVRAIVRARQRSKLDWGLKYLLTALGLLAPLSLLGLVLSWPSLPLTALTGQWETVYALVAILGVVGLSILGMLYKILPCLVWYRSYGPWVGRAKVPSLGDMYSTRLQSLTYVLYLSGLAGLGSATVLAHETGVRGSAMILLAALASFALNVGLIFSHWVRPRVGGDNSVKPFLTEFAVRKGLAPSIQSDGGDTPLPTRASRGEEDESSPDSTAMLLARRSVRHLTGRGNQTCEHVPQCASGQ